jgi:hypothetical protein
VRRYIGDLVLESVLIAACARTPAREERHPGPGRKTLRTVYCLGEQQSASRIQFEIEGQLVMIAAIPMADFRQA